MTSKEEYDRSPAEEYANMFMARLSLLRKNPKQSEHHGQFLEEVGKMIGNSEMNKLWQVVMYKGLRLILDSE